MRAVILVFRLPPKSPHRVAARFSEKLYGGKVSSWGGRYSYDRRGALEAIPHRKLQSGVLVLWEKDVRSVEAILREWDVLKEVRVIEPTRADLSALRRGTPPKGAHIL